MALTLIYPLFLGKLKPYQNLCLIISFILLLISLILSWFNSEVSSNLGVYLLYLSSAFFSILIFISLPFLFFKKLEIATITNGLISINKAGMQAEYGLQDVSFILNVNSSLLESKEHSISEIHKRLSDWGNYIIIPSEKSSNDKYIQFIPDEHFLRILPELKVNPSKRRSILMSNSNELLKNFIWMVWGAS